MPVFSKKQNHKKIALMAYTNMKGHFAPDIKNGKYLLFFCKITSKKIKAFF